MAEGMPMDQSSSIFPTTCLWAQCAWNTWPVSSILLAAAEFPCPGLLFQICFCLISICDRKYLLATCCGAEILKLNPKEIQLRQGAYELCLHRIDKGQPHCRFSCGKRILLDQKACHIHVEWSDAKTSHHSRKKT